MERRYETIQNDLVDTNINGSKTGSERINDLACNEGIDLNAVDCKEKSDENIDPRLEQSENDEERNEKSILQKGGKRAIAGGMAILGTGTAPFAPLHEGQFTNEYQDYQPRTEMHAYVDDSVTQRLNEERLVSEHFEQTGEAIITPEQLERLQQGNPEIKDSPDEQNQTPVEIAAEMGHTIEQGDPVPEHPGIVDNEDNDELDENESKK